MNEKSAVAPGPSRAAQLLNLWSALEVLSPQTFRRPEDLLTASRSQVVEVQGDVLDWSAGLQRLPNRRVFHHVVLGQLPLARAYEALRKKYPEEGEEPPPGAQSVLLAVVVCDARGVPKLEQVSISSFGWAVPLALKDQLHRLAHWPKEERKLVEELRSHLLRKDDQGEPQPLTYEVLTEARDWLVGALGLPDDFVKPPAFFLREYAYAGNREPIETLLLNSFFLSDLDRARHLVAEGKASKALQRYLGALSPAAPRDVLRDPGVFAELLAPARTPLGRWPGPGRRPLVALQQAAVNAAASCAPGDIIAVNGPPGTGKTTLLRDVVAAVLTARAEVLATFDLPAQAFTRTGVTVSRANAKFELRAISPKLHGFELVVASSNNKAVENVSAELPGLSAIAEDLPDLRYFPSLATALRGEPCWGLVAAVLGNAGNISKFLETFWNDEDRGIEPYLATAAGTPRTWAEPGGATRLPRIVQEENPPAGPAEARARWTDARKRFQAVLQKSRQGSEALQRSHELETRVALGRASAEAGIRARATTERECQRLEGELPALVSKVQEARSVVQARNAELEQHLRSRPKLLARLPPLGPDEAWKARETVLRAQLAAARADARAADEQLQGAERSLRELSDPSRMAAASREADALAAAERELAQTSFSAPSAAQLASAPHAERHLDTPWFDRASQEVRDEVFVAAMQLHKAFIDAAAEPIRHNLAALRRGLWRPISGAGADKMRDLWATFALVVPVFSTTFASVERMFRALGPSSLGWLLVDEAGQATPQSAVGAILRANRVVVVGDPMQVEPVVTLPRPFIASLCQRLDVSAEAFAAPSASVQKLADQASPLVAAFELREGTRTVGLPLLVHRRCAEPMFGISNAIAYENLMVSATPARASRIGTVLRDSCWYHVEGNSLGHWCPEEGDVLVRMLRRLEQTGVPPDLYVISPFRTVAERARALVRQTPDLRGFPVERIGTIHTVQGREADTVILLLGAPDGASQEGARRWAGSSPNLLNVAVTRAQERLYVLGNHDLWSRAGCFEVLAKRLPRKNVFVRTSPGPFTRNAV